MTRREAAPAGVICPACGVGTPAQARFCPACGQPLLGGVEERRVVTVLFADLVASTQLVTALDPEAGRADEAEAAAERAGDQAAAFGANALVRRLTGAGIPGPAGSRTRGEMGR